MAESLRYNGKVVAATVSRRADKWYIAIQVEVEGTTKATTSSENQAVGVDFGISVLAMLSDGTCIEAPKATGRYAKQLRRLNQELSRRKGAKKGERQSANFKKTKQKLARLYAKMAELRSDTSHKLTTNLTRDFTLIGIEDLDLQSMMEEGNLSRALADASLYELRRQLTYKAEANGTRIVVADRYYPSSKRCSSCAVVKHTLSLSERSYHCDSCGFTSDRDLNAAINLKQYALAAVGDY